ncbi:MAG: Asp-tRNA(Asn)/Glu-tRNA(Gln) amidotransferase subunit GatC [Peptoniphilaceae bacterium]|nr:Asp-tRNA(Asn)/Glu-tRNA(Gln) amidotransferase subunit GatC [Peptoniphilaceae bacterium]MDY6018323.1 Asp-tRNA(Asn)/Glu-tRNA(Gln) amidotransferase subunit GatC [Anaerococcus sp.]
MDTKEVERIYNLANLSVPEEDLELMADKYNKVTDFIERIFEVDTTGVDMLEIIAPHQAVLRKDEIKQSLPRDKALENAKNTEYGYFKLNWKL